MSLSQQDHHLSPNNSAHTNGASQKEQQPIMITILKDLIQKCNKKSKKDSLLALIEQHDVSTKEYHLTFLKRKEFDDQVFFNKVHLLDQTLTTKAFERVKEVKKQMQTNPSDVSQKSGYALQLQKMVSSNLVDDLVFQQSSGQNKQLRPFGAPASNQSLSP